MPGMTDRDHFAAAALTGLLYPDVDDEFAMSYIVGRAYLWAESMLRERARTNLDAAPAAIVPEPEPEPAARRLPAGGTGDTPDSPQPIACSVFDRSQPIAKPTPVHTPPAHATPSVGSVPRDGTEPVAWGVANGSRVLATSISRMDAVDMQSEYEVETAIVPLYRHPPALTDAEREALERTSIAYELLPTEGAQQVSATLRGLLGRLGGGE